MQTITPDQYTSKAEKSKRILINIINGILWLLIVLIIFGNKNTASIIISVILVSKLIAFIMSEVFVKRLQVMGTTASPKQFAHIYHANEEIAQALGLKKAPKVIILANSSINALAIKFAQKKVIVLMSEIIEGTTQDIKQMQFILGHEMAHMVLDHGWRGLFELYKPPFYKVARELSCDNCGVLCARSVASSTEVIKKLAVGSTLYTQLDESYLIEESKYLYQGFSGMLLKRSMTHPTFGERIQNIRSSYTDS